LAQLTGEVQGEAADRFVLENQNELIFWVNAAWGLLWGKRRHSWRCYLIFDQTGSLSNSIHLKVFRGFFVGFSYEIYLYWAIKKSAYSFY